MAFDIAGRIGRQGWAAQFWQYYTRSFSLQRCLGAEVGSWGCGICDVSMMEVGRARRRVFSPLLLGSCHVEDMPLLDGAKRACGTKERSNAKNFITND